jgi:uncharacterized membrane protein
MSTDAQSGSAAPTVRLSPRWRLALLASAALNLVFIGGLISAFLRHGGPGGFAPQQMPNNIGAYVGTLPSERGRTLWQKTAEKRRAMQPLRQEVRMARRDALVALTAEPFERERFIAAQTRLIEAEHRQRLAQRDLVVEIAGSLTAEERRAYIRWRNPLPRGGGDDGDAQAPHQPKQ